MKLLTPLLESPYVAYTYAYPHKTAYRPFAEPLSLRNLWEHEKQDALFLYMHIPFCEMRCGFCNLFTTVDPAASLTTGYLDALERQTQQAREALSQPQIARMAFGGGTPTFLHAEELARLFALTRRLFSVDPHEVPTSVETSPLTATTERLSVLFAEGVERVSIGVQSFVEEEARAAGRPQKRVEVEHALEAIRSFAFPILNIDLIYGLPGQSIQSWLTSLRTALSYRPEELYLYPLYVRPLTGLGRRQPLREEEEDLRLTCYRAGRELLLEAGYTQVSMRMFQAAHTPMVTGPVYCVQDDGMLGLGCGARSYTHNHHYSSEYAVGAQGVRAIIRDYIATSTEQFAYAHYGFVLDGEEQRRRYILKSLLEAGGLPLDAYTQRFGSDAFTDLPELLELLERGLAVQIQQRMELTPSGLERSDAIGPWLYSEQVRTRMEGYSLQ